MNIYAQNILDRYKQPFHKDKKIDATIKHGEANHACGDVVDIQIEMDHPGVHRGAGGDQVKAYSFTGNGCAISMASADMLGDLIEGMTTEEALKIDKDDVYEVLGIEISVRRSKCALLALLAIQNGLLQAEKKELRSWSNYHL